MNVPPRDIGCKFAGQHIGIRAGKINVAVQIYCKRIDYLLPIDYFLYLVEKQIYATAFSLLTLFNDIIVKIFGIKKAPIGERLKVEIDKSVLGDSAIGYMLPHLR